MCDRCGIKHQLGYCKAHGKYVWVVGRRDTLRRCTRVEAKAIGHIDEIGVPEE